MPLSQVRTLPPQPFSDDLKFSLARRRAIYIWHIFTLLDAEIILTKNHVQWDHISTKNRIILFSYQGQYVASWSPHKKGQLAFEIDRLDKNGRKTKVWHPFASKH